MNVDQSRVIPLYFRILIQLVFLLAALSVLFVFYYLVSNGLKTDTQFADSQFLITGLNFKNYVYVWQKSGLYISFLNSLMYAVVTVFFTLLLGSLAGFAFAVMKFRFKAVIFRLIIATMFMSSMSLIVPLYLQWIKLHLTNSFWGMIVIYTGTGLAFAIFMMTTFFRGVPRDLGEAARIDGCSGLGILFRIYMPLSVPGIMTLIIMNFSSVWNDLLYGLIFLQNDELRPIMYSIASLKGGKYYASYPNIFAALTISTLPIILIFIFAQKYFVQGMTLGSIK